MKTAINPPRTPVTAGSNGTAAHVAGCRTAGAVRQLAAIYDHRGISAQNASLHVQADAMERGEGLAHAG